MHVKTVLEGLTAMLTQGLLTVWCVLVDGGWLREVGVS